MYILLAISYFDGTIFNWVQPRLEFFFWKAITKNKNKKRNKCFTDLTIFPFIKKKSEIKIKIKQLKNNF